jgi:hypothetical protein
MRLGRDAYWLIGYLLAVAVTYVGTQYACSRGVVAPVVPGALALISGAVVRGIALVTARRYGHAWAGLVVAGPGIVSVGLGLANLVR